MDATIPNNGIHYYCCLIIESSQFAYGNKIRYNRTLVVLTSNCFVVYTNVNPNSDPVSMFAI